MESFEEVYQKYLKEVYCFLLRLSGDREIAEELTQQTFAIAFEKLENFRGECKLSVWLCQIAKHEYYAWTKKQKRYANKLDENHADQGEDLLNGIINQENGQIIRKILHDLQEPYKEVFMLRVMGEVSYRDIGQLFSKSESWAKVCSEDSRKLVEEHLAECSECRKYMKELETELEAVKQKKEEDLDEKRLLQEGAERMKEIGRKSIVDKMIIVDTLLNFLLIVTAVVLCKRQIDIEGADAGYYIAAMVFSFGFIITFFICDCITLVQKWKRRKMQTEWEYKQIPICESYAKISIGVKVIIVFMLVCAACILGFSQFGGMFSI